jgi:hypothetical protein
VKERKIVLNTRHLLRNTRRVFVNRRLLLRAGRESLAVFRIFPHFFAVSEKNAIFVP